MDAIANETRLRSVVTGEVISIVGSSQVHNNDKDQGEASRNVLEVRNNFSSLALAFCSQSYTHNSSNNIPQYNRRIKTLPPTKGN